MKKYLRLVCCLCLVLAGCQVPDFGSPTEAPPPVRAAMLLPLSGKSAPLGEAFLNSALIALQERPDSPLELLFFDTAGTAEGTRAAWHAAQPHHPDLILGPVFAAEVAALNDENPHRPVLSFTTDTTQVSDNVYSLGVLIPDQLTRLVQFMCASGAKQVAVLGPEDKTAELTMNALAETIERCPDMKMGPVSLYAPDTVNLAPAVLKIVPQPVDPRKKNLTEAEKAILETPIADRLTFDALFIFEDGVRLQQLISLLSYYDVTPTVVPFYGLANWRGVRDRNLIGGYFTGTPETRAQQFATRYRNIFGEQPPRIASLGYDAVSLVSLLAEQHALSSASLTRPEGFNGVNGRFRLRDDGTNERLLEIFQINSLRRITSVSPVPPTFIPPDMLFEAPLPPEPEDTDTPEDSLTDIPTTPTPEPVAPATPTQSVSQN